MSLEKNVIFGGPMPEDITNGTKSLGEFMINCLNQNGNKVALIDGVTSEEITFNDIRDKSIELAKCLRAAGINRGDVIGLISENRTEFPFALFGTLFLGATIAPLNLTYTERELHHSLNLSKPKIIFASPYNIANIVNVAKNLSFIKYVVLYGDEKLVDGVTLYSDFLKKHSPKTNEIFTPCPVNIYEDISVILCSSGTTGLPKGVQLTHHNIMAAISLFADSIDNYDLPKDEVCILGVIPWFHAFGCMTLLGVSCNGAKIVFLPKFEEGLFLSCIENYRVNMVFVVPPLMVFLAKHPLVDNYDLSSLRELLCGAAPLSKETEDAVYKRIKVRNIRQGFGMSETTLAVLVQREDFRKPGSVGTLSRGTYAKIIDPDTGKVLGPNQPGELLFKGTQIMKGYIGDQVATQNTIDKDGWLHSGDIGYYDNDHHFFIIDRLKELIKYKAYQVPPAEIESVILTHDKIKDCAVIGLPDESSGELPLAFVVKQPNAEITERDIIKYVEQRVSPAKRLRGGVRFLEEIPKNLSGKILRRDLRDMLKTPKSKL